MGELAIRRNRGFSVPQYQGVSKGGKTASAASGKAVQRSTVTISGTLQQLMSRVNQNQVREGRRTLQAGEGTLAEVKDSLDRMAQLAEEASRGDSSDRAALQAELETLVENVDRMLRTASAGGTPLFLDGDTGLKDGTEVMLYAVMGEKESLQSLPDWLVRGLAQNSATSEQLLGTLGLDQSASGAELLAAVANLSLESSSAADWLAALYLGAVISGGNGMESALTGLEQLLEKVSEGVPMDEAIALLTNGAFDSLADFQAQFSGGSAPGLEDFLVDLLLTENPALSLGASPFLSLLEGMEGMNLDLLMGLLTVLESENPEGALIGAESGAQTGEAAQAAQPPMTAVEMGNVHALGRDLSGVSFDEATGVLTVSGSQDVTILGNGQGEQAIVLAGSGRVTVQNVNVPVLTVTAPEAQLFSAEESVLGEVRLEEGTTLTLDGRGLLRMGKMHGGPSNILRVNGGAVILTGEKDELGNWKIPVQIEGAVSLAVPAGAQVPVQGKEPFDLLWKTLLPNWSHLTSVDADGKQARMLLANGEPGRLWLTRGEHGYPAHTLLFRGRDRQGRPLSRYAYLVWNQTAGGFREMSMYPNPFAVEGGEPGKDWIYEEESHTLHILSSQVTAISGGSGTDANQVHFSGRIVLADAIGPIQLTLGGVACRVSSGRAFDLGKKNDVTLTLESGTRNYFESGAGCAGISLGEGTSLCIDSAQDPGEIIASGASGGAGIGRDSGMSRDRLSRIIIRGGVITATGTGGGAGIGAGKGSAFGAITILGGTVTCAGEAGGGAGIGGALGAEAGDISVQGGAVTATASSHAAAIGAGVQGACGDIHITGTARVVKAVGGDPGADIGPCLFGGCGQVLISGGADIGSASLGTQTGIPLQMGEDQVTLPQFRLSAGGLGLDKVNISTQEWSREAQTTIEVGRKLVARIQGIYRAMYGRLGGQAVRGVQQYIDAAEDAVRDSGEAGALLESIGLRTAQAVQTHSKQTAQDARRLLR